MRRVDRPGAGRAAAGPLEAGGLVLEPGRHEARVGDTALSLTPTEFRLLEALVRADGDIVPHLQLARAGWPAETDPDLLWLKPHLARLRAKVEEAGGPQVVAVRGVGYRIVVDDAKQDRSNYASARGRLPSPGAQRRPPGRASDRAARSGGRARSCAASAQVTRQPRASRPPSGLKWNHASPLADRRQPQAAHVTGAPWPSRTAGGVTELGLGRLDHRSSPVGIVAERVAPA